MNANALKGKIVENGLTLTRVAEILDVSGNTLCRKMNTGKFYTNEVAILSRLLGLTEQDIMRIFFTELVTSKEKE